MYQPDNWVIIKFKLKGEPTHYRVLGGWSGGYLDGDYWRMNSGITSVTEDDGYFYFHGASGSIYKCNRRSYCLRMNNASTWTRLQELHGDKVELMDEDTDWLDVDWSINKE